MTKEFKCECGIIVKTSSFATSSWCKICNKSIY